MPLIRVQRHSRGAVFLLLCSVLCITAATFTSRVHQGRDTTTAAVNSSWEDYCPHTICQGVAEGRFLDNPFSCASFFRCVNGHAQSGECTDGTWFNYQAQMCDAPWHVPCDASQSTIVELECVTKEEPKYSITCRGDDLQLIQHPHDCNQYYMCVSGIPMPRSCAPGLEFNVVESQCMEPEQANCNFLGCPPYNFPMTFLPSKVSCQEFSICYFGEAIPHSCAEGLHWDPENNWCNKPEIVNCQVS